MIYFLLFKIRKALNRNNNNKTIVCLLTWILLKHNNLNSKLNNFNLFSINNKLNLQITLLHLFKHNSNNNLIMQIFSQIWIFNNNNLFHNKQLNRLHKITQIISHSHNNQLKTKLIKIFNLKHFNNNQYRI